MTQARSSGGETPGLAQTLRAPGRVWTQGLTQVGKLNVADLSGMFKRINLPLTQKGSCYKRPFRRVAHRTDTCNYGWTWA